MTMTLFPADITELAERVVAHCKERGIRVALAESCTGGLVAGALTEVPGSSDVLDRGYVVYSNEAKIKTLGVGSDIIDTFGAVSEAVAWAMAKGALEKSGADVAVAITGIAGPGGATQGKPVGLVVFAIAHKGASSDTYPYDKREFGDLGRTEIRLQAVRVALDLLLG